MPMQKALEKEYKMTLQHSSTTLWEQFDGELKSLICRKMGGDDECHDILQDLYLKIFININRIEKAQNVRSYILQMAHNAITDHFRKQHKKRGLESDDLITLMPDDKEEKSGYQLADC